MRLAELNLKEHFGICITGGNCLKFKPMQVQKLDEPSTPAELAYQYIRQRILTGEFRPGMSFSALGLSKKIGVSRTPVLFAFRDLEKEGLLTIRPGNGASVRTISSIEEYEELLSLREVLETFAAGLAAQRRTEGDLMRIGLELDKLRHLQKPPRNAQLNDEWERELNLADSTFHLRIVQATKHQLLLEEFSRHSLIHRVIFSPFKEFRPPEDQIRKIQRQSLQEHVAIYEAINKQDVEAARSAMEQTFHSLRQNNLLAISAKQDHVWWKKYGQRDETAYEE